MFFSVCADKSVRNGLSALRCSVACFLWGRCPPRARPCCQGEKLTQNFRDTSSIFLFFIDTLTVTLFRIISPFSEILTSQNQLILGGFFMKATGIVRRIDDLGRVVIPKEIRRTMRIREGDPSLIVLTREMDFCMALLEMAGRLHINLGDTANKKSV